MNRSLGTSSLPRCRQYEAFQKSAEVYFGGTSMSRRLPVRSSSRCFSQVSSHSVRLSRPFALVPVDGQERDVLVGDDLVQDVEQVGILPRVQPRHGHHVGVRAQQVCEPVDRHRPGLPVRPVPQRPLLAPIQQPGP